MKNILLLLSAPFLLIEFVLIYFIAVFIFPLCTVIKSSFVERKMVRWICANEKRCDNFKNVFQ